MTSFFEPIITGLLTALLVVSGGIQSIGNTISDFFTDEAQTDSLGADVVKPIAGSTYYLAGSGISSSDTSITLTSFTIPQTGYEIVDSDLSDTFYITLEPGSRTRQEIVSCTTVTQSSTDSTATLSGCTRGLSPLTDYTSSTTLAFAHSGSSNVILSDPPQLFNQYAAKDNDETITGQWTFDVFPITPDNSPATATSTGTVELATGEEAASSTLSGDIATSKLALHTGISTSTAPASGNYIPVTGADGNLDINFLPLMVGTTTVRTYTATTTTHVWTLPAKLFLLRAQVWGAGGAGGRGDNAGDEVGGGGGGGYTEHWYTYNDLTASSSYTVTVGTGGASLTADGDAGGGGLSSFDTVIAYGGGGGAENSTDAGGGGGGGALSAGGNATGATAGSAGLPFGSAGGAAGTAPISAYSGAGGGGATSGGGVSGGFALWGGGGGGGTVVGGGTSGGTSRFGGNGGTGAVEGAAAAGAQPGGGGGAGFGVNSGAGGAGKVIITEYY